MDNVLVLFEADADFRRELENMLGGCAFHYTKLDDTSSIGPETAADTTIIFGNPGAVFLKQCKRLKWLQLQSSGANGFTNGEAGEGVLLTSATGGYGHAVSEHMVGLTFELMKKLHLYRDEQAAIRWQERGKVKSITDSVVVVAGFGDIGSHYARRMKALGSYIIGVCRTVKTKPEFADELVISRELETALPRADVLALALPATAETAGFIGRSQLALMKKDAVIINAGRGSTIDTEALCDALEANALGGAALDVTDPEPLPKGHRLWKLENAVITPHVAGFRYMKETGRYVMKINLENTRRFICGEPLINMVDPVTGYVCRNS